MTKRRVRPVLRRSSTIPTPRRRRRVNLAAGEATPARRRAVEEDRPAISGTGTRVSFFFTFLSLMRTILCVTMKRAETRRRENRTVIERAVHPELENNLATPSGGMRFRNRRRDDVFTVSLSIFFSPSRRETHDSQRFPDISRFDKLRRRCPRRRRGITNSARPPRETTGSRTIERTTPRDFGFMVYLTVPNSFLFFLFFFSLSLALSLFLRSSPPCDLPSCYESAARFTERRYTCFCLNIINVKGASLVHHCRVQLCQR